MGAKECLYRKSLWIMKESLQISIAINIGSKICLLHIPMPGKITTVSAKPIITTPQNHITLITMWNKFLNT